MDTSCRVSQIGDSIEAREQGILNSHARRETRIGENVRKTLDLSMGLTIGFIVPHWGNFFTSGKIRRQTRDQERTTTIKNVMKESKA
jgi:hypothetical protein